MLPYGQFRGCPGQNTTNTMHLVIQKIKDACWAGKVTTALFLNIQGAFPYTVQDCLLHNMREHGVPLFYICLAEWKLSNCHTHLKFDDFTSDWFAINNSTTQGCPLSVLYYVFYNMPLIAMASSNGMSESLFGFVNNVMLLAVAKSLMETHAIVKNMVEWAQRTFAWSLSHNSSFELSKLAPHELPMFTS
ncbi:hypothetical protein J132_06734 [Termitomyces sp. J132]|nr:hypothetical protein J132_06734 [Termitomyces sp. J132]